MSTAVPGEDIFQTGTEWITVFFVLTMGLNLCCTGAIVAKIQWTKHRSATSSRTLFPVVAVIIESGAIYTTSVLGLLIAYLNNSNGQYAALDLVTPLVGVVYCLIVLQIRFQLKLSRIPSRGEIGSRAHQLWRHSPGADPLVVPKAYPLRDSTLGPSVV
ncbi:hypothetical protein P691DRAFT_779751 [Macrolepiota fuliginosa MF-IS2]|uniref:Uncharacterized protein n=1 Tax=Macrolepiota fuliginosa MF-IS2 TaxID=1400762 RepID=A0A9P5X066_9AGAR|nr:hypothetical protein P691DRAFT_779751 [Macrolepiota fuliginosa MF-IS2]